MTTSWSEELRQLRTRGVTLASGMTEAELQSVEHLHRFRFPPDLRSFLGCALPTDAQFPAWRTPNAPALLEQLEWPFEGIAFDIEHNAFWWDAWGPRPDSLSHSISVAREALEAAPRMIPIYAHRYLPASPEVAGNPVFSVHQTDVIHYGSDLRQYLACEFGPTDYVEAVRESPRRIPFWTELVEANERRLRQ